MRLSSSGSISLGEVGVWGSGGTPSRSDPSLFTGDIPWLKTGDLNDGVVRSSEEFISHRALAESSAKWIPAGAVLVAMYGASIGRLGLSGTRLTTNQAIAHCRVNESIARAKYLFYWIMSQRGTLVRLGQGAAQPNISQTILKSLAISLPTLRDQDATISSIECQLSRIGAAVASLERAKSNVKRARASVLKAAVEGRLVPTEAELARREDRSYEHASVLLERLLAERKAKWLASGAKGKYKEPVRPDTSGLRELPEGWCWASVDQLAETVGGLTKDAKRTEGRSVAYLRVANVQRGSLDLSELKLINASEEKIAQLRLEVGDVLMNEGGDRDKLGRGWIWRGEVRECIHQNHVFRARLWLPVFDSRYLSHYTNTLGDSYFFQQGKQTTNLASISLSKVKALPVALPPTREIERILREIDRQTTSLDAVKTAIDSTILRTTRLRQSVLKLAFEGRIGRLATSDRIHQALNEDQVYSSTHVE